MIWAQLVSSGISNIVPGGRSADEAVKAAILSSRKKWKSASAITAQASTFLATGLISIPCAIASWHISGASVLTIALLVHTIAVSSFGIIIHIVVTAKSFGNWIRKRSPKLAALVMTTGIAGGLITPYKGIVTDAP